MFLSVTREPPGKNHLLDRRYSIEEQILLTRQLIEPGRSSTIKSVGDLVDCDWVDAWRGEQCGRHVESVLAFGKTLASASIKRISVDGWRSICTELIPVLSIIRRFECSYMENLMAPDHNYEQQDSESVLVSGASFAGLATAFWFDRLGYTVTVIEIAPALRRGGTPVDLEAEALSVVERMGLQDAVLAAALPPRVIRFKNADGTDVHDAPALEQSNETRYEIHRDDLLDILFAEIRDKVEVRFGQGMTQLSQDPDGVSVTLDDGSRARFAMVVGCDGNRSKTRQLAFADHADPFYYLGGYSLIKVVSETDFLPANTTELYSRSGVTAMLNGYTDRTDVALAFHSPEPIDYDHRDKNQQRQLFYDRCRFLGWKVPRMLDAIDEDDDFYFGELNQIRMPAWSVGRVVLVGDAGYCVSPLAGMGGSMALIGAARLAEALTKHPGDYAAAFDDYDASLRPFVEEVQRQAATEGFATIFPSDDEAPDES